MKCWKNYWPKALVIQREKSKAGIAQVHLVAHTHARDGGFIVDIQFLGKKLQAATDLADFLLP